MVAASDGEGPIDLEEDEDEAELDVVAAAPKSPRPTPFGSVWDSQLGTPTPRSSETFAPIVDDEDFDEPEIPEYLIAEQRRGSAQRSGAGGGGGGRGGPRGGRAAYQSAVSRERYGRGGGGGGGGINRYPDVSGRTNRPREDRSYDRGPRPASAAPAPRADPG